MFYSRIIFARLIIILASVIFLSSCICTICPHVDVKGPCDYLIDPIRAQGVQVITMGDHLRLILPVDQFFEPASTKIKPEKGPLLSQIAELTYCMCYGIYPVTVTGYTDNMGTIREQKRRSYEQAHKIAAFLWSNGIPLNRIRVRAFGARRSLASNETPLGSAYNRRVEITVP